MRELPTRRVALLREGAQNPRELRELLTKLVNELKPYRTP